MSGSSTSFLNGKAMMRLSSDQTAAFQERGFLRVPAVFAAEELSRIGEHILHLRQPPESDRPRFWAYPFPGFIGGKSFAEFTPEEKRSSERLMRIHLFDAVSRAFMLDERLFAIADGLLGKGAFACHCAFFAKPPGSRGICTHTDNAYFKIEPSDIVGMQVLLDPADADNGALTVVPGSHRMEPGRPRMIPMDDSISPEEFPIPDGMEEVMIEGEPGDVICFHGAALHGSAPNRTADRWRRAVITHYVGAGTEKAAMNCQPLYRRDGSTFTVDSDG